MVGQDHALVDTGWEGGTKKQNICRGKEQETAVGAGACQKRETGRISMSELYLQMFLM